MDITRFQLFLCFIFIISFFFISDSIKNEKTEKKLSKFFYLSDNLEHSIVQITESYPMAAAGFLSASTTAMIGFLPVKKNNIDS